MTDATRLGFPEDASSRWERVGRQLLIDQLERAAGTVRTEMYAAASTLQDGDDLTAEEVAEMRQALERASYALRLAEDACPETTPMPDPFLFLDEEGEREFAKAAKRQPDGKAD